MEVGKPLKEEARGAAPAPPAKAEAPTPVPMTADALAGRRLITLVFDVSSMQPEDVQRAVDEAGILEGMVLVSAMHITAGVWVNDDEPGLQADALEWLDKLAPPYRGQFNRLVMEFLTDNVIC